MLELLGVHLNAHAIDVQRPLGNDLWVFLFQSIDTERIQWANRAGSSVFVNYFIVNLNKCLKLFIFVNTVTPKICFVYL